MKINEYTLRQLTLSVSNDLERFSERMKSRICLVKMDKTVQCITSRKTSVQHLERKRDRDDVTIIDMHIFTHLN